MYIIRKGLATLRELNLVYSIVTAKTIIILYNIVSGDSVNCEMLIISLRTMMNSWPLPFLAICDKRQGPRTIVIDLLYTLHVWPCNNRYMPIILCRVSKSMVKTNMGGLSTSLVWLCGDRKFLSRSSCCTIQKLDRFWGKLCGATSKRNVQMS